MRLPTLALLLAACAPPSPTPSTRIELLIDLPACESDLRPAERQYVEADSEPDIAWEVLCVRDDADLTWFAIKVARWDDRGDDLWNVWYVDPAQREVEYGEDPLPGADDPNNTASPDALVRVPPRDLAAGDYRVEVWAIPGGNQADAQVADIRLTALADE